MPELHILATAEDVAISVAEFVADLGLRCGRDQGRFSLALCGGSTPQALYQRLAANALKEDPKLEGLEAYVDDSGEGRWTVEESVELAVPLPVISIALQARFRSRQENPFGFKLLAAMRNQFGGHAVRRRT